MPQNDAGPRMEPPVSSPSAMAHSDAAMATPEPVLEPPGKRSRSHGLRTGSRCLNGSPWPAANSVMFSLPNRIAPADFARAMSVASSVGT